MKFYIEILQWNGSPVLKLAQDQIIPEVDQDIIDFINKSNLSGKNVIDGGSNIGLISLLLSDAVGDNGLVYSFELQRIIYQIGCANAVLNGRNNIISLNAALSNESGKMVGFTSIDYFGERISSTGIRTEPELGSIDYYDRVKTIAIDDLNIQNVGLIKLDLEGSEPSALDGMWRTIDQWKPRMIIEISPGYLGNNANDLIEKIKSHGYSLTGNESYNYFCEPI
jgi:FkbM family methyltransferase